MIAQYRKKPIVIDAVQYNGSNRNEIFDFCGKSCHNGNTDSSLIIIHTLEGNMVLSINDYLIKGVKGEFYPCKPDIFEMTYERVTD